MGTKIGKAIVTIKEFKTFGTIWFLKFTWSMAIVAVCGWKFNLKLKNSFWYYKIIEFNRLAQPQTVVILSSQNANFV